MIRAFRKEDLDNFKTDDNPDKAMMGFWTNAKPVGYDYGITMTWYSEDIILGIGGVIPFWNGVGEGWMSISKDGRKHPMKMLKDTRWFLDYLFQKEGYHRIQCVVMMDYPEAHRYVLRCGFIPESMMVNYGPGKEHFTRYVRIGG